MSSRIFAAVLRANALPARWIDARQVIVTDAGFGSAVPQMEATRSAAANEILPALKAGAVAVMGGFVGATSEGITTTLGRGGSDVSAAVIGAAMDAEEIQIWTDVDGKHDQPDGGDHHAEVGGDVVVAREGAFEGRIVVVEDAAEHEHGDHGEREHEGQHERLAQQEPELGCEESAGDVHAADDLSGVPGPISSRRASSSDGSSTWRSTGTGVPRARLCSTR